jgi:putative methionine-R-sulfoxide reductase with GAF domain
MANGIKPGAVESTAGALLGSMQAVQQALVRPAGLPPEQLVDRLQEWQGLVEELAGGVAQGAELATLYEITQVLNSSLDLTETLNVVMDSLIHLTGAERGCLMLLDEEGDLGIRAAQHFGNGNAACSDLELSQTVVRKAMEEGQPVLTTNAQLDPRFSAYDSVVGYHLRSIVCVPLRLRGRVIGALYLDNRVREGVFSEERLPLLMAFANQAAAAIENARLYTMTDQALAARLEELTTLQQIDQELNASLDFERVMELTLSWAMQATKAEEGVLCILDDAGAILTVTTAGDDGGPAEPEPGLVRLVIRSHEPIVVGRLRIVVPIRFEDRVVGLLDLRSNGSPHSSPAAWRTTPPSPSRMPACTSRCVKPTGPSRNLSPSSLTSCARR